MGIMDEIVPEPPGAAHNDPMGAFPAVREAILRSFRSLVRARARPPFFPFFFPAGLLERPPFPPPPLAAHALCD